MRRCTNCGKIINEGYCIYDGCEYYCSDECLRSHYNDDEYQELYEEGNAYWTKWENEDIDVLFGELSYHDIDNDIKHGGLDYKDYIKYIKFSIGSYETIDSIKAIKRNLTYMLNYLDVYMQPEDYLKLMDLCEEQECNILFRGLSPDMAKRQTEKYMNQFKYAKEN